jgi:hypothetical protein
MIAVRAEKLVQIILGPGQIRHRIAGEESCDQHGSIGERSGE